MTRTVLPRRSQRRAVALAVQCRTQGGLRDDGEISDISVEGCCLRIRGIYFRVGARLIVRPSGMDLAGIAWAGLLNGALVFWLWYTAIARLGAVRAAWFTL